ncbi:hypothetical protein G9A89_002185 [Geosiphon pyriformis]|nr:hypothetical protein G9A89_002185 [Geosiphon pyriformis]
MNLPFSPYNHSLCAYDIIFKCRYIDHLKNIYVKYLEGLEDRYKVTMASSLINPPTLCPLFVSNTTATHGTASSHGYGLRLRHSQLRIEHATELFPLFEAFARFAKTRYPPYFMDLSEEIFSNDVRVNELWLQDLESIYSIVKHDMRHTPQYLIFLDNLWPEIDFDEVHEFMNENIIHTSSINWNDLQWNEEILETMFPLCFSILKPKKK